MDLAVQLAGLPTLQLVQGESVSPKTQEVSSVRIRSVLSHSTQAIVEGALISLLVVGLMAGTAFAAKPSAGSGGHKGGGSTASGSLALVMVTDLNGDGSPDYGDAITFKVTTTASYPTVDLRCYQSGTLVYSANAGFYPSYPWPGEQLMPLTSPAWTGGAASCTATLNTTLATLNFTAGA